MEEGSAVINLPSFGKIHTARVYEGMAAGRPVITVETQDRPHLASLFKDGRDLLLYPRDNPSVLAGHIKHLLDDPDFGRQIAMNARDKLLRYHTMEFRVAQFLDWIATRHRASRYAALPADEAISHRTAVPEQSIARDVGLRTSRA